MISKEIKRWTEKEFAKATIDVLSQYQRLDAVIPSENPDEIIWGLTDYNKHIIYLHKEQIDFYQMRRALIHEVLHGYYNMHKVKAHHPRIRKEVKYLEDLLFKEPLLLGTGE